MSNPPNIEDIWQEYLDQVKMNCVYTPDRKRDVKINLSKEGEEAIHFIFDGSIKILIEVDKVEWIDDPKEPGIARRFILSMAAAVGRFASKLVGLQERSIDRRDIEATFFALAKDWEKVCPLPIVKARVSCPIPPVTGTLRDLTELPAAVHV